MKRRDPLVRCSTPGCDIVVGNGEHGAKTPRPCCRCSAAIARAKDRAAHALRRASA